VSKYKVRVLIKARKEVFDAFDWYEEQQEGLGDKFSEEIQISINKIQLNPNHHPLKTISLREFVVKKYPFVIVYKISERREEIIITSIFHTKRNPKLK
jgi:hypothetical protein